LSRLDYTEREPRLTALEGAVGTEAKRDMARTQRRTRKAQGKDGKGGLGWDIMSPAKRSALMARIRGRDTGPELAVRRILHAMGYRFRLHARDLPGRPDIVLRSRSTVVFVHGCFWHRHDCGLAYTPRTRHDFWQRKFNQNVERDRQAKRKLEAAGWRVVVVWECQLDRPSALTARLAAILGPVGQVHKSGNRAVTRRMTKGQTHLRAKASRPRHQHGHSP
jgi:DNA mismatch endonuclease, patch repair protein